MSSIYNNSRYILPEFYEKTAYGQRATNPYSKLFEERIIFLGSPIDDASAGDIMAQLLCLESADGEADISIYINSPGGSFTAMSSIYDTMQYIKPQISTICLGQASSASSLILAAGTAGKRFILPHSKVTINQPYAEGRGQGSDIEIQANEILRMRSDMEAILSLHTGKSIDEIQEDIERDKILTAEQAVEYGIVDKILNSRKLPLLSKV
jgi:ATP-dependent Clp protease protease subunit